jgi:hypothetical protein
MGGAGPRNPVAERAIDLRMILDKMRGRPRYAAP